MFAKCTLVLYEPLQDFYGNLEFTEYYNSRGELLSDEYERHIDLSKGIVLDSTLDSYIDTIIPCRIIGKINETWQLSTQCFNAQ
jgi:hypothetical protein